MKHYVRFVIYANMPSLIIMSIPAIINLTTGGNWLALMAFYNLVLYIIPVSIIHVYLIRSFIREPKPQKAYIVLNFVLSTICMVLFIVAWSLLAPIVALVSYAVSFFAVKLYWRLRTRREATNTDPLA